MKLVGRIEHTIIFMAATRAVFATPSGTLQLQRASGALYVSCGGDVHTLMLSEAEMRQALRAVCGRENTSMFAAVLCGGVAAALGFMQFEPRTTHVSFLDGAGTVLYSRQWPTTVYALTSALLILCDSSGMFGADQFMRSLAAMCSPLALSLDGLAFGVMRMYARFHDMSHHLLPVTTAGHLQFRCYAQPGILAVFDPQTMWRGVQLLMSLEVPRINELVSVVTAVVPAEKFGDADLLLPDYPEPVYRRLLLDVYSLARAAMLFPTSLVDVVAPTRAWLEQHALRETTSVLLAMNDAELEKWMFQTAVSAYVARTVDVESETSDESSPPSPIVQRPSATPFNSSVADDTPLFDTAIQLKRPLSLFGTECDMIATPEPRGMKRVPEVTKDYCDDMRKRRKLKKETEPHVQWKSPLTHVKVYDEYNN